MVNVGKYTVRPMDPIGMVNDGWDDLVKLLKGHLFIDMLYSKPLKTNECQELLILLQMGNMIYTIVQGK